MEILIYLGKEKKGKNLQKEYPLGIDGHMIQMELNNVAAYTPYKVLNLIMSE